MARNKTLIPLFFVCILALGCAKSSLNASNGGDSNGSSLGPDLQGTWKGDLGGGRAAADPKDVSKAMAQAFISLMSMKMRIRQGNAFRMSMMGSPIDGHYAISGKHMTFTSEKIMGKTPAELKSMKDAQPGGQNMADLEEPMEADLSADNQTITVHANTGHADLVFKRTPEPPDSSLAETVKAEEKSFVGNWTGKADVPNTPGQDASSQQFAKAMMQAFDLDLRRNNTFSLDMIVEISGTWSKSGNILTLNPIIGEGMGQRVPGDGKPMAFTVSGNTLTSMDNAKGTRTFTKSEG